MRTVEEIKADLKDCYACEQKECLFPIPTICGKPQDASVIAYEAEMGKAVINLFGLDRLEEICNAERDGRCLSIPKDAHQPMFVKADAVDTFDKWNDVTGAIPNGISWYYEAEAVIEEIAAMAFGCGIFYEAERKAAEKALKEREQDDD